jgi:hypothetical protein
MFGRFWVLKNAKWMALGAVIVVALAAVFGLLVEILWNWLMPDIFGLPHITYLQAWGMVILAHVLLGGNGGESREMHHHHRDGFREKVRERFRGDDEQPQEDGATA